MEQFAEDRNVLPQDVCDTFYHTLSHKISFYVSECFAKHESDRETIDVAECESECEPDGVTYDESECESECVAVCGTVCVADVVS